MRALGFLSRTSCLLEPFAFVLSPYRLSKLLLRLRTQTRRCNGPPTSWLGTLPLRIHPYSRHNLDETRGEKRHRKKLRTVASGDANRYRTCAIPRSEPGRLASVSSARLVRDGIAKRPRREQPIPLASSSFAPHRRHTLRPNTIRPRRRRTREAAGPFTVKYGGRNGYNHITCTGPQGDGLCRYTSSPLNQARRPPFLRPGLSATISSTQSCDPGSAAAGRT